MALEVILESLDCFGIWSLILIGLGLKLELILESLDCFGGTNGNVFAAELFRLEVIPCQACWYRCEKRIKV